MFRTTTFFLLVALFGAVPSAHSLDLAALEGMLSNDDLFDGDGGRGSWDDFGGGGGWDSWGAASSTKPAKKKEAPKLKEVASDKERFMQDMPDGTEKLPKKHKETAREYLHELTNEIRGLHSELTSMKLNIALQESLQATAEALPPALEKLSLISSKSSYLLTLYRKDFNPLRKKIIDVAKDTEKARGAFTDLPGIA
ncbi:MAG: hypothetical protein PVJ92_02865, partial [Candidatus Dependentiae bacterium]